VRNYSSGGYKALVGMGTFYRFGNCYCIYTRRELREKGGITIVVADE
jgi:hypothetical protein